jgi:hypothetical protein
MPVNQVSKCPSCHNTFMQPFMCTTCGAQQLYDESIISAWEQIDRLSARVAELEREKAELRKALDMADEAMAFEVGGEPLPTLMVKARERIAALKEPV